MPNVPRYRLFSGIKKRNSFQAAVCQYAERDAIGLITPLLLGYSVVTCLPAVHKRDDLRLFACFLISPRLTAVDLFQLNEDTDADIQFTSFIFGIGRASDVTAAPLKLGAKLFLRKMVCASKCAEIIAHIPVTPDLLLHFDSPPQ